MKRLTAIILSLFILSGFAGCGKSAVTETSKGESQEAASAQEKQPPANQPQSETNGSDELVSVKLSTHPAPHSLPTFAAMEKGWYEEAGLDVTNTNYIGGPPQMEALPGGAWSMGIAGISAAITGALNYDLRIVGFSIWDDPPHCIFAREDNPIYQAGNGHFPNNPEIYGTADLYKGITILATKGTVAHLNILEMLKAIGLEENDVNIVHMEIPAAFQAFRAGEGDAMCTWSTYTYEAEKEGWKAISSAEAVGLHMPSPFLASDDIVKNDPESVQKYMNVAVAATQWVNDPANLDEMAEIYYNVCLDEGVKTTLEDCSRSIQSHSAPTVEEMEEMLAVGEDGLNGYQRVVGTIMDLYIDIGAYTEEQKQKVLDSIDVTYLEKAIENYKASS